MRRAWFAGILFRETPQTANILFRRALRNQDLVAAVHDGGANDFVGNFHFLFSPGIDGGIGLAGRAANGT